MMITLIQTTLSGQSFHEALNVYKEFLAERNETRKMA